MRQRTTVKLRRWAMLGLGITLAGPAVAGEPTAATPAAEPADAPEPAPVEDEASGALIEGIELGPVLGFGARLDAPPLLRVQEPAGLLLGLGADVYVSSVVGVGLRYEHLDLGVEGGEIGSSGTMRLERDVNSLWLGLRAYPFQSDWIGAFVGLGLAGSWQSLNATGVVWRPVQPGTGAAFACEGADSIAPALRAVLGVDATVGEALHLWASADFDSYRFSEQSLDGCGPGAGSAAVLGLQTGLGYRFSPGL
jgi:hypothetical protein